MTVENGKCALCGKPLEKDKLFLCKECQKRYKEMDERDYHLKDVLVFRNGRYIGRGLLDENRNLLFSGYVTCEMAKLAGFEWKDVKTNDRKRVDN